MPADLAAGWELSRVSHSHARFDMGQLLALNRRALHTMPFEAVRDRLPDGMTEAFWNVVRGNIDLLRETRDWLDVATGDIIPAGEAADAELLARRGRHPARGALG
jgi:glutamyl-tRNA synthetase